MYVILQLLVLNLDLFFFRYFPHPHIQYILFSHVHHMIYTYIYTRIYQYRTSMAWPMLFNGNKEYGIKTTKTENMQNLHVASNRNFISKHIFN